MRRFTICRLMMMVAFLSGNLAVLRLFLGDASGSRETQIVLLGLLPLADVLAMAWAIVAYRYRVEVRLQDQPGGFATRFAALGSAMLLGLLLIALISPMYLLRPVEVPSNNLAWVVKSSGYVDSFKTPLYRLLFLPAIVGVLVSGPPLLFALGLAAVLSRFTLVIAPREACADSPSSR